VIHQFPEETDGLERLRVLASQQSLDVFGRDEEVVQLGLKRRGSAEHDVLVLDGHFAASAIHNMSTE
jgi:hypothetical protein